MSEQLNLPEPTDTQQAAILAHFKAGRSLTKIQALNTFRCLNLGDKVYKLRKLKFPIEKRWEETAEGKRYAVYFMAKWAA